MLCFRVFVRIHSLRSLDSFIDLNPILCSRFLNSFPCHTSKKLENNPFLCHTSAPPGAFSFRFSTLAKCILPPKGTPSSSAHSPIFSLSPYPLSFQILAHSFAFFCTFLHWPKTQLFCFQSIPHSLPKTPGVGAHAYSNGQTQPIANAWRELSSTDHRTRDAEHELPVTAIPGAAVLSFGRNLELTTHD